jgi:hypothetical protein
LQGTARLVEIANITYQGVEEMTPVMHFAGQTKRLVMSPQQVQEMLEITGTILYPHWIGTRILLQPKSSGDHTSISISAPSATRRGQPMPAFVSEDRRGWYLALSVVGILMAASVAFALLNLETVIASVQLLRDNWFLR